MRRRGEATALDGGDMFAHSVHFINWRAAFQQRVVQHLLVFERNACRRQGQKGRPAPRNQRDDQIVRPRAFRQREDAAGGLQTGLIRDGVGRLDDLDPLAGNRVVVAGDDQPFERVFPDCLEGRRHRG